MTAISDLDIFARVARTGNMSAAGREMGLSPAVVSKRISLLEEKLGARLFQRTTRHLTLTETGEGFFKRVVDILSLVEEAQDFVSRRNTKPRGMLKLSAPTTFSRMHIAPYLTEFLNRYPEIELDVQSTDNMVDIIREGYDLAIRIGQLEDSSLVAKKLAPENRVMCASPKYLAEIGIPNSLDDLEMHNCLSAGAQDTWRLEGPEGNVQFRPKGNIRSNSAEFVREALLSGVGIGLRSTWDIGTELANGSLKVVLPQYRGSSNVGIYAVYPCREFMPSKVNVFIEFLNELYGVEPYWDKSIDLASVIAANSEGDTKAATKRKRAN
ncbi:MAG: LysR family transcriptional regulator [Hyphomicrobiaceae bacterium]|nr:LysR family transcriptional regulator [Hyphomicrobiaceae bacterium]